MHATAHLVLWLSALVCVKALSKHADVADLHG
jgi:hypothetical protein